MNPTYLRICRWLDARIGLALGPSRAYLLDARLQPLLRQFQIPDLDGLADRLERVGQESLKEAVIDAMATHESSWFRDQYPFDLLANALLPARSPTGDALRLWSAACANGQEAWSLAITLQDFRASRPATTPVADQILASDVSPPAVVRAAAGVYTGAGGLRGLDDAGRARWLMPHPDGFSVVPTLRARVRFAALNVLEDNPALGLFDVIFFRNVLVYMTEATQVLALRRLAARLLPGGYLVLGAAERLPSRPTGLAPLVIRNQVIYQLASGGQLAA